MITHRRTASVIRRDRDERVPAQQTHQVLVVVPTYRDGARIVSTLARVRRAFPGADVLVVDDRSPDDTAHYAARLGEHLGHITVVEQDDGRDPAWRIGSKYAADHGYDIVVELHAEHSEVLRTRSPASSRH